MCPNMYLIFKTSYNGAFPHGFTISSSLLDEESKCSKLSASLLYYHMLQAENDLPQLPMSISAVLPFLLKLFESLIRFDVSKSYVLLMLTSFIYRSLQMAWKRSIHIGVRQPCSLRPAFERPAGLSEAPMGPPKWIMQWGRAVTPVVHPEGLHPEGRFLI